MDYNWINEPFIDALDYFSNTFYYFAKTAREIGTIVFLFGFVWNCILLIFSTLTPRKLVVGTITKFVLFLLILYFYFPASIGLRKFVTTLGSNVGLSGEVIKTELFNFMTTLEKIVESEKDELSLELETALSYKNSLRDPESRIPAEVRSAVKMARGYDTELLAWNAANERVQQAQQLIEERQKHPGKNERTIASIREVLKPIDSETGEPMDGNYAKNYALSIDLYNSEGKETGFLSPSAILRISVLCAQIIWEKEWTFIQEGVEKNKKENKNILTKNISFMNFEIHWLFEMLLAFLCMILLIAATVFALIQYVMCILEYTIVTSVGVILIPLILSDQTKDFANKLLPCFFGFAIKLLIITMCMFFATYAFLNLAINVITENSGMTIQMFAYVGFITLLAFVLTQNGPQVAVSIITGTPQLSMGEFIHAAGTLAAMGGAAVAGGKTAIKAGAAGIRSGANRLGDVAGMAGAAKQAAFNAFEGGAGTGGQLKAGVGAAGAEAMRRAGVRLSSAFSGFAHSGSGGKSGGGGGTGYDRHGSGAASSAMASIKPEEREEALKKGETLNGAKFSNLDYASAQNVHGQRATFKEYLAQQFDRGKTTGNEMPAKEPHTTAKYPKTPASSQYIGSLPFTSSKYLPDPPKSLPPPPPSLPPPSKEEEEE